MKRKGVSEVEIEKRVSAAQSAFPDAMVTNYENLIEFLKLPDSKDRHVLAAAIKTNANIIVTNNLKDFPQEYLFGFGLRAQSVDDFLTDIIDLNPNKALEAFKEMVINRRNPPCDEFDILDQLRNVGLNNAANFLHSFL